MTQRPSQPFILSKSPSHSNSSSHLNYTPSKNFSNPFTLTFTQTKNAQLRQFSEKERSSSKRLSSADVGRITGSNFKQGQLVKGQSRINYVPYEKKVIDYQTRTYTEMVPKTKKIIDYHEKIVVQNVPRQVVRQQYYPVQRVTKVCKQIVDVRPVQKKVKKLQYIPVEKKIVHYPQHEDYKIVQNSNIPSKIQQKQIRIEQKNQFAIINQKNLNSKHIESHLHYEYSGPSSQVTMNPGGQNTVSRKLVHSKSPYTNPSLNSSNVEVFKLHPSTSGIKSNVSKFKIEQQQPQEPNPQQNESNSSEKKVQIKAVRPGSNFSRSKILQKYASTGKLSAANYV